jgi:hypothetical protein
MLADHAARLRCYADCNLVKDLHARGNEIADHTVNHPSVRACQQLH